MALDAGTLCGIDSVPIYLAISGCEVAYGFNKVADVVPDNISGILDDAWPGQERGALGIPQSLICPR